MAINYLNKTWILKKSKWTLKSVEKIFRRYKKSALFIPGSKAYETFSYLTPHLDFDDRFTDLKKLDFELQCRNMNADVSKLKDTWELYKSVHVNREDIEKQRDELTNKIRKLINTKDLNDDAKQLIEALKLQGSILRNELKSIKKILWELEESVIPSLLDFPNEINEMTPIEPVILRSIKTLPKEAKITAKDHISIGESLHLIEYKNPMCYYLTNEAALFEIGLLTWIGQVLNNDNFFRISGTDFNLSYVVEAAGFDQEDPNKSFILENSHQLLKNTTILNKLHLVGGASFFASLAMHTKQLIKPKSLPIKYYASGRQYIPKHNTDSNALGLFGVNQESVVHCFAVVKDKNSQEYQNVFQEMIQTILNIYDELGLHYRIVLKPACQLKAYESLNISFELWSRSKQDYVEVGNLSMCGDYCSKRLLIAYQTPQDKEYPAIISGTILSVSKLLGCLLEENEDQFVIPECVKKCIPLDNEDY